MRADRQLRLALRSLRATTRHLHAAMDATPSEAQRAVLLATLREMAATDARWVRVLTRASEERAAVVRGRAA